MLRPCLGRPLDGRSRSGKLIHVPWEQPQT